MIEITKYEKVEKNKIVGYVDVKVASDNIKMTIRRIAHFKNGDREWFGLPVFGSPMPDGRMQYTKYWEFDKDELNVELLHVIKEKTKEYLKKSTTPTDSSSLLPQNVNEDLLPF